MKSHMKPLLGSFLAVILWSGIAHAEDRPLTLSLLGGFAVPTADGYVGEFGGSIIASPVGKASLMWQATPAISLGIEGGYAWNHGVDFSDSYIGYIFGLDSLNYKRRVLQLTPEIEIGQWFGSLKPYITVGGGWYRVEEEFSMLSFSDKSKKSYGGFNGGVGLLAQLTENVAFGPDIRYHHILTSDDDFHYVDATLRLALRF